jgi:deoxyadenosine/deoxycytidine kinase
MVKPVIISIEGNIGSGKSTFFNCLKRYLGNNTNWIFLEEPVHVWESIRNDENKSILKSFYENPEKYSFAFQVMAYTSRLHKLKEIITKNPNCTGIICERSLEADKNIFAKMLFNDGLMDTMMYKIYDTYFSNYEKNFDLNGIIFIDVDPEKCFKRIEKRARNGENKIDLDYLKKCNNYHKNWLCNIKMPILKLNLNNNVYEDSTISNILSKTESFIKSFEKDQCMDQCMFYEFFIWE